MTTREMLTTITIAVLVVGFLMTLTFLGFHEAGQNRVKVVHMTDTCISQGFSGWKDSAGCFGGHND